MARGDRRRRARSSQLLGVDVTGWFSDLWDALTGIGLGYLVAGWVFQTAQTTLTALGWFFILRAAYPRAPVPYRQVLAAYAAGVALNGFLPANIGTFAMLLMFVAIIPGANFPGVLGGMLVQKIFFTLVGTLVYVYLFASVPGTFERQFKLPHDQPVLTIARARRRRASCSSCSRACSAASSQKLIEQAKQGGAILARPREYLVRVALPSLGAWLAKLAVIAVFLAGLRDRGHVPHGDVGGRRQLDRQHRLGHARAASASTRRRTSPRSTA